MKIVNTFSTKCRKPRNAYRFNSLVVTDKELSYEEHLELSVKFEELMKNLVKEYNESKVVD